MGQRVIADFMTAADDLAGEFGMRPHLLADHEEDCFRVMAIQQLEQARRILRIGAVVEGDENFRRGGGEMDGTQPLAAGPENRPTSSRRDARAGDQCPWPAELEADADGGGMNGHQ